jgi:outer membrane protein TolC
VLAVCLLAGCSLQAYKDDADKRVYDILDSKWDDSMGPKANYRVSDVTPGPNDLQIEKTIPASGVLTLPDAVALATAYNRDYHLQKERLYTTALDQRLVEHFFEFQPFGGGKAGYERADANSTVTERLIVGANVGFNRLLRTGGVVSMQMAARWADILRGGGHDGLTTVFSAAVFQPLLRGSDIEVVLEPLTQAERDTLYQLRTFNRYRQVLVVQVIAEYYRVLEQYALARNARDYDAELEATLRQVEDLVQAARLPKLEADRVRQDMLAIRDHRLTVLEDYGRLLDAMKITLGVPATLEFTLDTGVLDVLEREPIPYPDFDPNEAVDTALRLRLDVANSSDMVVDAERHVRVAIDGLRTGVNLTGTAEADTRGGSAAAAAVEVDLPLDRVREQSVYRKELLRLNQRLRDYELATDSAAVEVRQAYRRLAEAADRDRVLSEALALAENRVKDMRSLLQYARISSRRMLDAQQALFETRNKAVEARVAYAIATLEFYRDTGVLRVKPDGMWETPETQRASLGAGTKSR